MTLLTIVFDIYATSDQARNDTFVSFAVLCRGSRPNLPLRERRTRTQEFSYLASLSSSNNHSSRNTKLIINGKYNFVNHIIKDIFKRGFE